MYFGGALKQNEDKRERGEDYDEQLHKEYEQEFECKSRWLQHFKLMDDLMSDPDGIETRPLSGLNAVNYLDPGGLVKHASWVFHPVTKALIEIGYEEGKDLDAAPYDWRIPPSMLESRDSYFSNTMKQIESMYGKNDNTPVVLLCHSMGCKTCHYFLNFAKQKAGQEWIEKYVHTYFPVGAPHLGAPKSLRGTIVGDKMGLDAFLSEEEALISARSFGSVPWMYSSFLPEGTPPTAYLKREGVLHFTIDKFDVAEMGRERKNKPTKLRLAVTYNNNTLYSSYHAPEGDDFTITFPETFTFAAPPDLSSENTAKDTIRVSLYEPGLHLDEKVGCCTYISEFLRGIVDIMFPVEYWRWCPCVKAHSTVSGAIEGAALTAANVTTAALGTASLLATTVQRNLSDELTVSNNPAEFSLQLRFGNLRKMRKELWAGDKPRRDVVSGETSSIPINIQAHWIPPQHDVNTNRMTSVQIAVPSKEAQEIHVHNIDEKRIPYEAVSGVQLLKSEYLPRYREMLTDVYETDPLDPRGLSSREAPPVKRVKAVYGIDLPTEVGAVYRRRDIVQKEGRMMCLHEVDKSARIDSADYEIEDGLIMETEKTPQTGSVAHEEESETVLRSGDGTVRNNASLRCLLPCL